LTHFFLPIRPWTFPSPHTFRPEKGRHKTESLSFFVFYRQEFSQNEERVRKKKRGNPKTGKGK